MSFALYQGDAGACARCFPQGCVRTCITSPPYWGLRDYGVDGQIGLEVTPEEFVAKLVAVFREVRQLLADDGTLWVVIGDCFTSNNRKYRDRDQMLGARGMNFRAPTPQGLKAKELVGIPWRLAFALQADGWFLRSDIIWHKLQPMPESVQDRPTRAHEYVFMFAKSERYFYNHKAILEPFADARMGRDGGKKSSERNRGGRDDGFTTPSGIDPSANGGKNKRSVWSLSAELSKVPHYASYPTKLVEPMVLAGSAPGDLVLDPFCGTATTGVVALRHGRRFVGFDLSAEYLTYSWNRLTNLQQQEAA